MKHYAIRVKNVGTGKETLVYKRYNDFKALHDQVISLGLSNIASLRRSMTKRAFLSCLIKDLLGCLPRKMLLLTIEKGHSLNIWAQF